MALTALGAGLATCALLALLSSEGDVCPADYWVDGLMGDAAASVENWTEASDAESGQFRTQS